MNAIIGFLNYTLSQIFQFLMTPLAQWPLMALLLVSVITGIILAVMFRFTSNQRALGQAADKSRGELLAINLFQDELGGVFRSLGRLLKHSAARIGYSIPPVLVIIVPLLLLLFQLASWYEWRPLPANESAIVEMQINRNAWQAGQHATLVPHPGWVVEAGPLRDVGQLAVYWRIRPRSGDSVPVAEQMEFEVAGQAVSKRLAVAGPGPPMFPVNPVRSDLWWEQFLYPLEPGLAGDGPVQRISVHYPGGSTPLFGWDLPWWLTFLIVSMLAAFAVKPWVGVKF